MQVFQTCLPFGSDLDDRFGESGAGGRVLNVVLSWSVDECSSMNDVDAGINPASFCETDRQSERAGGTRGKSELVASLGEVSRPPRSSSLLIIPA